MNTKPASYDTRTVGVGLRDYFAAAALQGMLAATPEIADYPSRHAISELAYMFTDAMLKEREREQ